MTRVKNGVTTKARHKKVLKAAKGYFGSKHRLYKTAKEQLMHSGQYAYRDRRQKKRDFRKLWITRINAACRENEISYSRFIEGLNYAGIEVNRKMASEIAINDAKAFTEMVNVAKKALEAKKDGKEFKLATKVVKAKAEPKKEEKKEAKKETAKKEVKKETKKETKKEEKVDYSKLTVAELKEVAKKKDIKIPAGAKKADIIVLLK